MKKYIFSITIIFCLYVLAQGQVLSFNSMGTKGPNMFIRSACRDSLNNLYIVGTFNKVSESSNTYYYGLAKWDGTNWDSLGTAFNVPGYTGTNYGGFSIAYYKNHIYVGGVMTKMGGRDIRYIAKWNGLSWDSLPQTPNAPVGRLIVLNGKLYVFGTFNKIGSVNCNKMAVWDGTTWNLVYIPFSIATLADVAEYNGDLYVGGNISESGSGASVNLIKFDGTNWTAVGGGILGGFSWVNALKVFNNELYIGGYIVKGAGNAGDFLVKWDGSSYKEVIQGLNGQIWNLTEVPDGLIATGCFHKPSFSGVFKISNAGVCGYDDIFSTCVEGAVYNNNLLYFYGGYPKVNNDSIYGNLSYVNYVTQTDTCVPVITIGVKEYNSNGNLKEVFPNPTNSTLNFKDEQNDLQNSTLEVINALGQTRLYIPYEKQINVSMLPSGFYNIKIKTDQGLIYNSKFIKE